MPKYPVIKIIRSIVSKFRLSRKRPVIVSFTGGMGAQIISTAIYFHLKSQGYSVFADFRYFEDKDNYKKKYSTWEWQLDCFNLSFNNFRSYKITNLTLILGTYISDGELKTKLAIEALSDVSITSLFYSYTEQFKADILKLKNLNQNLNMQFACVHLRRGDYLNVASHIVSETEFLEAIFRVQHLVNNLIIISDSKVSDSFKNAIEGNQINITYYDSGEINYALSHYLMTQANILICSNSQFSWTAGKLAHGLVLVPRKWYGGELDTLETLIHRNSNFLIM
jgi:hypothetical protein